jgi:inosine-uridine nucleoside N-ribohydrolase
MTMCPLDITTPHTIPFSQLIHDAAISSCNPPGPLREFTGAMLIRVRELMKAFGLSDGMEMHDPLAIWYAVANPPRRDLEGDGVDGWKTQKRLFKVERMGEYTRGMCVVDRR